MRLKRGLALVMSVLLAVPGIVMPIGSVSAKAQTKIAVNKAEEILPYQDTSLSFEERAADLVSRMTLEEKVAQLGYKAAGIERLGVAPYDYWKEALHGVARQGAATSFPTALSMSNTWNTELIYKLADATSTEARAKNDRYNLSYWSPTINMARDPRWGRNEESMGEDPYLTGQLGAAFVNGMQGNDTTYLKTIATLKHFAANNNEAKRSSGTSVMTEFNMRNYYTKAFQNITESSNPGSVMSSYNATTVSRNGEYIYNFIPSLSNSYLLKDLLRRSWGFKGYVTSDCGAGEYMLNNSTFKIGMLGSDKLPDEQYIGTVYKSGLNLECNLGGGNKSTLYGVAAVMNGYLSEKELEHTVYELFLKRFQAGEFDEKTPYTGTSSDVIECDEHVEIAEKTAEESWVLLKNDNNTLPLGNSVKKAVVVGNMANTLALGDYSSTPTKTVTPIQGITTELDKKNIDVNHLGVVSDDEPLFNIKSINLILKDGTKRKVDLSKAEKVSGMTLSNGTFTDVTTKAVAVISNVDFLDVVSVEAEMATGGRKGGSLNIAYGNGGPTVASVSTEVTESTSSYMACKGEYTGADGGYNGKADMYISASVSAKPFSVEAYKTELDNADVIIAYAGTVPKQAGFGTADSSESKDRASINLPDSQSHVQELAEAYPEKTIVVMQTVGQINVEPFADKCKAILWTSYNGQTQGTALGKVLTGEVNPSGRLSTTWYKNDDVNKMELVGTTKTIGGITGSYTDYNIQADGNNPGHTYQYYTNTPVYPFGYGLSYTNFQYSDMSVDKTKADANDKVTISVNVKNTGSVSGKEVVQLYVSHPAAGKGTTPAKQLKGFEKVELAPGETKKVTFNLNVADMYLFDEAAQKDIVPTGTYTAYISSNADDTANKKTFDVTGTLNSVLKNVTAIPDGVSVDGLICEDGSGLEAASVIKSNVTAVMSNEVMVDLTDKNTVVSYKSADNDIASVDSDGNVKSGKKEGVTTVTVSVTVDGVTKTDSYPVVNKLQIKPYQSEIDNAKAELKTAFDRLPKSAYSEKNYSEVTDIYNKAVENLGKVSTRDELDNVLSKAVNDMNSVDMDKLESVYNITSVNPEIIKSGVIDYRDGGIPEYNGATGTITNASPYTGIALSVSDKDGKIIDNSKLTWKVQKTDDSVRKTASVDENGNLTVYGNGIIQITATDLENMICGKITVHVNTQIEAEYADNGNGASLTDSQKGSSGGFNVGSAGDTWIEYKAVKLSNLDGITARYAGKNDSVINISLDKSALPDKLIASSQAAATGTWDTWADTQFTINEDVVYNAQLNGLLDENGCTTVYVQTNGSNLDYFRLNYIENNDDLPYIISKVTNRTNGRAKVTIKYRGSVKSSDVKLTAQVLNEDSSVKSTVETVVSGTGEYEIETGAVSGDIVKFAIYDANGKQLSDSYKKIYKTPKDSEIVVYNLENKEFDYTKLTGGTDGTVYADTVNGLCGYGSWTLASKKGTYTYTDANDKTYEYSFNKAWQAGSGSTTKRSLYFTPKAPCKVTAVFLGGDAARSMTVYQSEDNKATQPGTGSVASVSLEVKDTQNPVYIYGGSSNKQIFAVIVEYYADGAGDLEDEIKDIDTPVQFVDWGGAKAVLTKNDLTDNTKVWIQDSNGTMTQLSTEYFAEADVAYNANDKYTINALAVYKDRLYASCDNGLVIVFTSCQKCYKLKKVSDFDNKTMTIENDIMTVSDGINKKEIEMGSIGGNSIEPDEANVLLANGAKLIDVRTAEEFEEKWAIDSINIPLDTLETGLSIYDKSTPLIFACASGVRAESAVKKAMELGYTNVYNLGSFEKMPTQEKTLDPTPTPNPTPTPDPTPNPTPGTDDSNGNGGNSQGTTDDTNTDESKTEQSKTEESVATGESGLLWYSLSAAVTALGAGFVLTGKKCRKDEE